jgi:capsular polysaccharide biosynthesis protein
LRIRSTWIIARTFISLGVVFYELLTGELPLGKFAPPSRKVQVDVRLDEVVLRALEKEPARRYQQASEVKGDVETIAAGPARTPFPFPPGSVGGKSRDAIPLARSWAKRLIAGGAVALAVFILFCAGAGALTIFLPRTYVATAKVLRDGPPSWFPGNNPSEIKSDIVLSRVATELGLAQRWAARREASGALRYDEVLAILRNDLEVLPRDNSAVIDIRYSSERPNEAAEIANKVAEASRWGAGAFRTTIIERAQTPSRAAKPNLALGMGAGVGALSGLLAGALTMMWVGKGGVKSRPGSAKSAMIAISIMLVVAIPAGILIAISALKFRSRTPTQTTRVQGRQPVDRAQSITNAGLSARAMSITNTTPSPAEERLRAIQTNRVIEAATPESAYFTGTFSNRYGLASHIMSYPKKDRVLATLARDAAGEGDIEIVRKSLKGIVSFVTRDSAAHDAARALAKRGMRAEALEAAKTITSFKAREDALTELSQ